MKIEVEGVLFDDLTESEVVDEVFARMADSSGGHILTPNVDVLRQLRRTHDDLPNRSTFVVPDGMPIVWASRIQRTPLRERVTGASLVWSLSEAAAANGASVFLLGGAPGVADQAAEAFQERYPGLTIAGTFCPPFGFEKDQQGLADVRGALEQAKPDIVFIALGYPKQDSLASTLSDAFPGTWFLGCGGALTMAANIVPRAPSWVGAMGLEWLHRFAHEPRRMFRRYFVDDAPFATRLLLRALRRRLDTTRPAAVTSASPAMLGQES